MAAYCRLGQIFAGIGDVESSALMYRVAVDFGPDQGPRFRRACRAMARACRRARDRDGLEWLASTLEAWPESKPWAQDLASRIRAAQP